MPVGGATVRAIGFAIYRKELFQQQIYLERYHSPPKFQYIFLSSKLGSQDKGRSINLKAVDLVPGRFGV
jgi:hypothetical protein